MALAVLDGNQTATTLSSVVTGGEHIVAHSVVSLGSAAISNITSAVSGSVVSISNFPASQSTTFGAVTGSVSVLNFPATQPVSIASVTVGNSVTIGSLPAISGTVTANVVGWDGGNAEPFRIGGYSVGSGDATRLALEVTGIDGNPLPISGTVTVGNSVTIGSLPAISGTVTANVFGYSDNEASYQPIPVVPWDESVNTGRAVVVKVQQEGVGPLPISGTVTVGALNVWDAGNDEYSAVRGFSVGSFGSAMQVIGGDEINLINGRPSLPVAGTVTVSTLPSGALTTRFGSVTTANTAQITSAVTNTSRKYLLAQNISAGTVTIGIGFSPTTTQGIQLTAGGGLTFDAFCPTGAVYWLGAVTGANYCLIEG